MTREQVNTLSQLTARRIRSSRCVYPADELRAVCIWHSGCAIRFTEIIELIPGKIGVIRLKTNFQNQNVELATENEQKMPVKKRSDN